MCGAPVQRVSGPYEEHKSPKFSPDDAPPRVLVLLDNIRSVFNVGSIFRTADGAGVEHLSLCGITATPDNPRLKKTALGAHESVPWSFHRNAFTTAQQMKSSGISLWALEGGPASVPISHACRDLDGNAICLVVGNEICGVDPGILSMCEKIIGIPMGGIKTSLNTAVAFGIAVYTLRFQYERQVRSTPRIDGQVIR